MRDHYPPPHTYRVHTCPPKHTPTASTSWGITISCITTRVAPIGTGKLCGTAGGAAGRTSCGQHKQKQPRGEVWVQAKAAAWRGVGAGKSSRVERRGYRLTLIRKRKKGSQVASRQINTSY
eukprot:91145-Chlamydomonas_euryale.AAC.5